MRVWIKHLKRRLRRAKRIPLIFGCGLVLIGLGIVVNENLMVQPSSIAVFNTFEKHYQLTAQMQQTLDDLAKHPQQRAVRTMKRFLCGEETASAGYMDNESIERIVHAQPFNEIVVEPNGGVLLIQEINDLSAVCKASAFISMDEDGNLVLFEGTPEHKKAIRTFFQLDIEYMKSSLSEPTIAQLNNGIRIHDLDEYNSVLSTFSDYAVEETP